VARAIGIIEGTVKRVLGRGRPPVRCRDGRRPYRPPSRCSYSRASYRTTTYSSASAATSTGPVARQGRYRPHHRSRRMGSGQPGQPSSPGHHRRRRRIRGRHRHQELVRLSRRRMARRFAGTVVVRLVLTRNRRRSVRIRHSASAAVNSFSRAAISRARESGASWQIRGSRSSGPSRAQNRCPSHRGPRARRAALRRSCHPKVTRSSQKSSNCSSPRMSMPSP
jgi:hypothetical protein